MNSPEQPPSFSTLEEDFKKLVANLLFVGKLEELIIAIQQNPEASSILSKYMEDNVFHKPIDPDNANSEIIAIPEDFFTINIETELTSTIFTKITDILDFDSYSEVIDILKDIDITIEDRARLLHGRSDIALFLRNIPLALVIAQFNNSDDKYELFEDNLIEYMYDKHIKYLYNAGLKTITPKGLEYLKSPDIKISGISKRYKEKLILKLEEIIIENSQSK